MAKQYRNGGENEAQLPVHHHHDHDHDHQHEGAVASNAALSEELQGQQQQSPGGGFLESLFGGFQSPVRRPAVLNEPNQREEAPYTISDPRLRRNFSFRGVEADAHVYTITFEDGPSFEIIAPAAPQEGLHYHTVAEAAEAASHQSLPARRRITSILLNAVENPDDPHWAAEYNNPDFHSYMTAGRSGQITIYPDDSKDVPGQDTLTNLMVHETGHTWSYQTWGNDKTRGGWARWQQAMDHDGRFLSDYATNDIAEDVAETIQGYASSEGTRRHDELRRLVPNRFALLDREYN